MKVGLVSTANLYVDESSLTLYSHWRFNRVRKTVANARLLKDSIEFHARLTMKTSGSGSRLRFELQCECNFSVIITTSSVKSDAGTSGFGALFPVFIKL